MAKILVVDDEDRMRHLLSIILGRKGYQVEGAQDGQEALSTLQRQAFDLVITDIRMPRLDGHGLLDAMKEKGLDCPVIFITAFASVESAVEAMKQGVVDYISKPFEEDRILFTVERTLNLSRVMAENKALRQEIQRISGEGDIVYASPEMGRVMELAASVAVEDSAVLIRGESGTGKELIARFIHNSSHRSGGRFVPVNCAAISQGLVESELFGHEKGAFTGANQKKKGKFEYATGGTLFLDEIGDLPLEAQAKLLRVLQDKKVQRVGGNQEIPVDVRIICATNQNLKELVEQGGFRSDVYYRVNVFPLEPPPLRERIQDIEPLARHFLKRQQGAEPMDITEGALRTLQKYSWPGNIRELANVIERACILARRSGTIDEQALSFLRFQDDGAENGRRLQLPPEGICLESLELDMVEQALEQADHNQSHAARLLGLTRAKFRVLMKQYQKHRQPRWK